MHDPEVHVVPDGDGFSIWGREPDGPMVWIDGIYYDKGLARDVAIYHLRQVIEAARTSERNAA